MLTFKNFLSNRNNLVKLGESARELSRKTNDPENLILDFVNKQYPKLYSPILEAFYLEAEPPPPPGEVSSGGEEAPSRPADAVAGDTNGPQLSGKGATVIDWLKDLFGGGGAKKNFDKALKALAKVDSVLQTVRVPADAQGEGGLAPGYDDFREKMHEFLTQLRDMESGVSNLNVADAIKKDPTYVQELERDPNLSAMRQADAQEQPEAPKNDTQPVAPKNVVNAMQKLYGQSGNGSDGDFSGFGTNADAAKAEFDKIKNEPDETKRHQAVAQLMRKYRHTDVDVAHRVHKGNRINESFFAEALVLAGIPRRK